MGNFIKKDLLVLLRDRTELLVLLLMPMILIVILSLSLRGILAGGDTVDIKMDVALVVENNEQQGVAAFTEHVQQLDMPQEIIDELLLVAKDMTPYSMLLDFLEDERMNNIVQMKEFTKDDAIVALENGDVEAILTIPNDFTYDSLTRMLLHQGTSSELMVNVNNYSSIKTEVFLNIMERYVRTFNFETAISESMVESGLHADLQERATDEGPELYQLGGIETIAAPEPITSFQYYTVSMAVMFVLFVASTLASKAYVEKKNHVFSRVLLSNRNPVEFLGGKAIATIIISFCQLFILFVASTLLFQTFPLGDVSFWLGILLISLVLAMCVGGLTALLTSISVRYEMDSLNSIFSGGIVTLFAFIGGSFFPTDQLPNFIGMVGNWTPNGAALTAYLQWMQKLEFAAILPFLLRIMTTTVILVAISIVLFPKRRLV